MEVGVGDGLCVGFGVGLPDAAGLGLFPGVLRGVGFDVVLGDAPGEPPPAVGVGDASATPPPSATTRSCVLARHALAQHRSTR